VAFASVCTCYSLPPPRFALNQPCAVQPAMFGAGQQQSGAAFGAPAASAPSFAFGQQPSNGSAPTFGQPAPAPAFGQAPAGMAPAFSGAFGGAPGAGTFAAGSSGSAPARRKVNVRRRR